MKVKPASRPKRAPALRGCVESRGPDLISGWAAPARGDKPVTLVFRLGRRIIGECKASRPRRDLVAAGVAGGRGGFAWRVPLRGREFDLALVRVEDKATGEILQDRPGLVAVRPAWVLGVVEVRGPDFVIGWAAPPVGRRIVTLVFMADGKVIGECRAADRRPDLEAGGVAGGRGGFAWRLPLSGPQIDVAALRVIDKASGATLPDRPGVVISQPPRVRGVVEVRGPEFLSGWASGLKPPLTLRFERGGETLGEVVADLVRKELIPAGVPGGRAGFSWRLPFLDPAVDPARIEVRDAATGDLLPDIHGLEPVAPKRVRGAVEARGPDAIAGWAKGAGGPVALQFLLDGEVIGKARADQPRPGLGDSAFRWPLPFRDPPLDPARIEVREARSRIVIPDAPGLAAVAPPVIRGVIEEHGPDAISGWAYGPEGSVTVQVRRGDEVLAEVAADGFRAGLRETGVGDGRAVFRWELPFGDPTYAAAEMKVVEVSRGAVIPDGPGVAPVSRPPVCGVIEERSYRLVTGWAWNGRPGERTEVEMVCGGVVVGRAMADRLRKDLAASGVDDGRHVFHWIPPRDLEAFDADRLRVVAAGVALPDKLRADKPSGLEVQALRIEASWLHARLRRTGEVAPPPSIDLTLDGRFLLNTDIRSLAFDADGWAELLVELPRTINDGRAHRVGLRDPREGDPIAELPYACRFNSMVELVTPLEIRGWVIDADDPNGENLVELYDGDERVLRLPLGRDRPEVAKAMGAAHAWEFVARRLPLQLYDGRPHELRLSSGGRPLSPHKAPRIEVCWRPDQSASEAERFDGAVQEINATGVKGFAVDYLQDAPLMVEVLVDGEVAARVPADRYVAALKAEVGHGFHGFEWRFPSSLMNGRRRRIAVRPEGRSLLLPPRTKSILFPLTALDDAAPPAGLAAPMLKLRRPPSKVEPALLSLIVLSLNGAHVLEPFLRSLVETEFRDRIEIILIDHGSTDETREIIEAYRGRLPLTPLYRGLNHSFSTSCNLGAALARGQHLVMVNNDIVFTGDCLAGMRDLLDSTPQVGLVGLRLLEPRYRGEGRWEPVVHHTGVRFAALAPQNKAEPRTYHPVEAEDGGDSGCAIEPAVTAALAMMRKADFRALGGFDEGYVYGYEDVDFALRMRGTLGKLAVCRLDDSAVHNRSATRESKLLGAKSETDADPTPVPAAPARAPTANLDLFVRRFSRHLPRLILGQLVAGGEAWRAEPLRITFVVADPARGPDAAAARALGRALRDAFGWEPMLIGEDGHELAVTDVLVCLRPGFDLRRIADAAPGMVAVAWDWNGKTAWDGRVAPYHLSWPAGVDAGAARAVLADLLGGARRRIAIKAQAENEPQARALAQALEARGQHVRVDGPRHWIGGLNACDELVVALAGVRAYVPFAGAVNALCLTPGAEAPEAQAAFDHVFTPGDPDEDAAMLLGLHERLRGEFLGGLAGEPRPLPRR